MDLTKISFILAAICAAIYLVTLLTRLVAAHEQIAAQLKKISDKETK